MNGRWRFGQSPDPWFRIGTIGVDTTLLVLLLGVVSMFVWAAEGDGGPILRNLWLVSEGAITYDGVTLGSVVEGQVWRLVTWPVPNEPDIWTIILFLVFYMLGSQLEALMGRRRFAAFLLALVLIPAGLVTALEVVTGLTGGVAGLRLVELGVLVAFAAQYVHARFFFGIPAWALVGVILGLDVLRAINDRDNYALVLLACTVATALLGIRALGYATEVPWIPNLRPRRSDASPHRSRGRSAPRRRSRSSGALRAVPSLEEQRSEAHHDAEIDALLDQVSSQGMDSLTRRQRKQLDAHAKRLRRRGR